MQKTTFKSEEELCERVVKWLRAQHWEVYQEVSLGYARERADIVATMGSLLWVIEAKLSVSMVLLEQSLKWIGYANMISMASLGGKRRPRQFLNWFWKQSGVGMITVCPISDSVSVRYSPRLHRIKHSRLMDNLCEEQKSFCAAGSKDGGYWTPYAQTCREVLCRVRKEPGITMKQLMDGLDHHYSSDATARACLAKWAGMGKIPGVRVERDGKKNRFFPEPEETKRICDDCHGEIFGQDKPITFGGEMLTGYYYLHTNGDLIFKKFRPEEDSPFVKASWPIDSENRMCAWAICVEALARGANKRRIEELQGKWHLTNEDAQEYAKRKDLRVFMDGSAWCATCSDFENLQESPAGFGNDALEALADLHSNLGFRW